MDKYKVIWVLGDQLFDKNPWIDQFNKENIPFKVVFIESKIFTSRFRYHKQKLLFLYSSMRLYAQWLVVCGFVKSEDVIYKRVGGVSLNDVFDKIFSSLDYLDSSKELYLVETQSDEHKLFAQLEKQGIKLHFAKNPNFLTSQEVYEKYFIDKQKFFFQSFYIMQRKQLKILLKEESDSNFGLGMEPLGGKWSYDILNRHKIPESVQVPNFNLDFKYSKDELGVIGEVKKDIERNFNTNETQGNMDTLWYPVTKESARLWFEKFLEERFLLFGEYEDAINNKTDLLYHSGIAMLLNNGLLDVKFVVNKVIEKYESNDKDIPLSSVEGFIRQVIGWREYVRNIYLTVGEKQKQSNFFNFSNSLPEQFYSGSTGVLPVDYVIRKVLRTGYAHHIERLMIIGNIMLLLEINPDEVYKWFMELFIDAYEWVMVPNVYGMSQFADGGIMMTKPYISGSNYIFKMSSYKKSRTTENITFDGVYWWEVWDSLYWTFIDKRRDFFNKNIRLKMMVSLYDKKSKEIKDEYKIIRGRYLEYLGLPL